MAAKTVPITGSVLAWARRESGFTMHDLAERLKVTVEDLEAWEAESTEPTRGQFSKLWKILRRPSAVFFLPEAPAQEGLATTLRNAPGLGSHKLKPEELNEIRRARRLQDALSWVLADDGREPVSFPEVGTRADPVVAADEERCRSGITTKEQLSWRSAAEGFRKWHRLLEGYGVMVMQLRMGKGNVRGFSVWDDFSPLVAVNSAYHPTAHTFTLFHEYGHLLRRSDAACAEFVAPGGSDPTEERWCERFAASFLLPEDGLREEASKQGVSTTSKTSDPRTARSLANRFGVSTRAMAIRLQELDLAHKTLYSAVATQMGAGDWNDAGGGGRGLTAPQRRIREFGSLLPSELIGAVERGRMTTRDLADYLQLKTGQLDDLKGLLVDV